MGCWWRGWSRWRRRCSRMSGGSSRRSWSFAEPIRSRGRTSRNESTRGGGSEPLRPRQLLPEPKGVVHGRAHRVGLPPDGYVRKVLHKGLGGKERMPPRLSHEETKPLQQINQGLPTERRPRYHFLTSHGM